MSKRILVSSKNDELKMKKCGEEPIWATEDTKEKLTKLYYYMLDLREEFIASYQYIKLHKIIVSRRGKDFINLINTGAKLLRAEHLDLNQGDFQYQRKIIVNNIVINITKIENIKTQYQTILRYVPNFNKNLKNFCNKFCTKELKNYRNQYVAHPLNKDKNILTIEELEKLLFKILGIGEFSGVKTLNDYIIQYMEGILGSNETLFNTHIMDFKKELNDLGITI